MKPVDQTKFGPVEGNCFRATIASIFELPLEQVPDFMEGITENDQADLVWQRLNEWLKPFNLRFVEAVETALLPRPKGVIHELSGKSPRGGCYHSVVGQGGEVLHDPSPDRLGVGEDQALGLFVAIDPAKFAHPRQPDGIWKAIEDAVAVLDAGEFLNPSNDIHIRLKAALKGKTA